MVVGKFVARLLGHLAGTDRDPADTGRSAENSKRGQSLVELALVFPFMLLLLAGLIEVGHYINTYLTLLDASREAARYATDLDPRNPWMDNFDRSSHPGICGGEPGDPDGPGSEDCIAAGCAETGFFYHKAACLVNRNSQDLELDLRNENIDVVVSVVAVISETANLTITERLPPTNLACTQDALFLGTCDTTYCCEDECSWSWTNDVYTGTVFANTGRASGFACSDIATILNSGDMRTGRQNAVVIIEVFYEHHMALGLPIISSALPNPIPIRAYSVMPVSAAEPTPTPVP